MKKRAGIARAMMLEPDLLFFDEPSAGLDPITAYELDQLILTLRRDLGITIVIVTHELPSIFLVADNCIVLDKLDKGIVARGDPRTLRDQSEIIWHLETADSVQLVGTVELVITSTDRAVHAHVLRGSEPVSSELPGNLAVAAGRLLQTLASASLAQASRRSGEVSFLNPR